MRWACRSALIAGRGEISGPILSTRIVYRRDVFDVPARTCSAKLRRSESEARSQIWAKSVLRQKHKHGAATPRILPRSLKQLSRKTAGPILIICLNRDGESALAPWNPVLPGKTSNSMLLK
jgi:hypothetical protein